MALKLSFPFPIFAPPQAPNVTPSPNQTLHHRSPTEIRLSRWNNANAEKFNQRRREIHEIEEDIRRERRFGAVKRITDAAAATTTNAPANIAYKSVGTPSFPSNPSLPGKKSKYSKDPHPISNPRPHPAFRRQRRLAIRPEDTPADRKTNISIGEDGVSYVVDGAPFEFKYSYTETPKVKPLKLQEQPYSPFGPTTMQRPWTGHKPLPESKKKLKEFDSFELPPPGKKGVKPVQSPGPFLQGSGPKLVRSREEIMGEPLTEEEIQEMVASCTKTRRQLNMGRDGLTHNMLDNIHSHWKRRRVCKIKCLGVCTVDMENVCQQLEEKTGGKIIYRRGGALYLFRGRNYNYKTRPRFPLMLWKPASPVYPSLIKQVPEGLTLKEATEMRNKGRNLKPIRKLAKNGTYFDLVRNVREAFEVCELVRINCQGLNSSDYRKIGAKLKDLVPCVLISFKDEHILMWRGQNWKSSLPKPEVDLKDIIESNVHGVASVSPSLEAEEVSASCISKIPVKNESPEGLYTSTSDMNMKDVSIERSEDPVSTENDKPYTATDAVSSVKTFLSETISDNTFCNTGQSKAMTNTHGSATILTDTNSDGEDSEAMSNSGVYDSILDNAGCAGDEPTTTLGEADTSLGRVGNCTDQLESSIAGPRNHDNVQDVSEAIQDLSQSGNSSKPCTEEILQLWRQAVDGGNAIVLDDTTLDADLVYERAVAFAKLAPPGPVFRRVRLKKVAVQNNEKQETGDSVVEEVKEVIRAPQKRGSEKKSKKIQRKIYFDHRSLDVVKQGGLRVDELAKLLG